MSMNAETSIYLINSQRFPLLICVKYYFQSSARGFVQKNNEDKTRIKSLRYRKFQCSGRNVCTVYLFEGNGFLMACTSIRHSKRSILFYPLPSALSRDTFMEIKLARVDVCFFTVRNNGLYLNPYLVLSH